MFPNGRQEDAMPGTRPRSNPTYMSPHSVETQPIVQSELLNDKLYQSAFR